MNRWTRPLALLLAASLILAACGGPKTEPRRDVPDIVRPSFGFELPSHGASAPPQPTEGVGPPPSSEAPVPLPADIVDAIDGIVDAESDEERIAATRSALESVGVAISDDEDAVAGSLSGIVLAGEELAIMAAEAGGPGQHRSTLADFAEAFGGMALLPPNDALADELPDDWLDAPGPASGSGFRAELDLAPLPGQIASVVTAWVSSAVEHHASTDAELVALTNAPLLLAELARRQATPLDIARPFAAGQMRLGWLEITLLVAGFRSMLAGAQAAGIGQSAPPTFLLAAAVDPPITDRSPVAQDTPCSNLKTMIDSRVPLVSTHVGSFVGDQIKGFIQNFVNALFGEASAFAQAVGRSFKVLGLLFRVQALIMIYSEARAEVTLDPSFYHKPEGSRMNAGATVEVGIPDAAWQAAQQARQLSPFATALRVCARFLGLPVWQDLVDVGDAMDGWKVEWKLTRGGHHVEIPARDQFASGRMERPLTATSDHTALDAITYDVLPERRDDHPGTEMTDTVAWCAHVYPKAPPSGFGTILSAYGAGTALAGGAYFGLVAAIASLLTSWVTTIASLEPACGQATVSFHVPSPGTWHGTITVNTTVQDASSGVEEVGDGGLVTWGSRTTVDVTDRLYVSGTDEGFGFVYLDARQFTSGVALDQIDSTGTNIPRGCLHDFVNTQSSSGGWSFQADAGAVVQLGTDGSYLITVNGSNTQEHVFVPGEEVNAVTIHEPSPHCVDIGTGTSDRPFFPSPTAASIGLPALEGHIDPANPGNALRGSASFHDDRGTTTVTWNLTHDGPIRLPGT